MTPLPPAALAAAEEIVQLLDECADVPSFKAGVAEIIARLDGREHDGMPEVG